MNRHSDVLVEAEHCVADPWIAPVGEIERTASSDFLAFEGVYWAVAALCDAVLIVHLACAEVLP